MKHLFVVTYGRSGSTFLLNALNAIDGYCIRGENGGLAQHMAEAVQVLKRSQEQFSYQDEGGSTSAWYGLRAIDADGWARALADEFSRSVLHPEPTTRVTGFKEVRYTPSNQSDDIFFATLDFLANSFPNARVVFNTRSSEQVAQSGWWTQKDPDAVKRVVDACDERFRKGKERLEERAFMIDYSQYNDQPEGFRPLLEWLGETIPDDQLAKICATRLDHGREGEVKRRSPKKPGLTTHLRRMLNR